MTNDAQKKGGHARAKALTKAERSEIARTGAEERWKKQRALPKATHGSPDSPLRIVDVAIDCYVLENGTRVLSQRGMLSGIGLTRGGARSDYELETTGAELPRFAMVKWLNPHISNELSSALSNPILFALPSGAKAYGYPATILADICDAVLEARAQGSTGPRQAALVQRCEMLVRSFARVGIVALVDEATGYQAERDRDELHRLLSVYLSEERLKWAQRFPDQFYVQLYRLKDWTYPKGKGRTPLVGKLTNQLVYDRLPPGVLDELRRRNPTEPGTGRRRWKHHQFLSEDIGQPDLRDHLLQLMTVMRIAKDWPTFIRMFEEAFPRKGGQRELDFGDDEKIAKEKPQEVYS